jgi:hypothetical protein
MKRMVVFAEAIDRRQSCPVDAVIELASSISTGDRRPIWINAGW